MTPESNDQEADLTPDEVAAMWEAGEDVEVQVPSVVELERLP